MFTQKSQDLSISVSEMNSITYSLYQVFTINSRHSERISYLTDKSYGMVLPIYLMDYYEFTTTELMRDHTEIILDVAKFGYELTDCLSMLLADYTFLMIAENKVFDN